MVTVATLERVSSPPGPKLTVPVGWKTDFEVPAAGVTLTITVMVDGGLAPFFLGPPKATAVLPVALQTIWLPPATGVDAVQTPVPLLSNVGVGGLAPVMFKPVGTKIVNWRFGTAVPEVLLTVQVMFPACPTFGCGLAGFPVTATAAERVEVAGNGTVVCWLALAFANAVPASSVPLATTVLRMAWLWICTVTVMVDDAPAARDPWLQVTVITPVPPAVQVP